MFTCEIEKGGKLRREYVKHVLVSEDGTSFKNYKDITEEKYNYIYLENIFGEFKVIEVSNDRKI